MTPSSQAKKSCFEVRIEIWVTVGKVLETDELTGEGGGEGEEAGNGGL